MADTDDPGPVFIVGGGGGMGRFLARELFSSTPALTLVDVADGVEDLAAELGARSQVANWIGSPPELPDGALVLSTLRTDLNEALFASLARSGASGLCVVDIASSKAPIGLVAEQLLSGHSYFGIHPLFGPATRGVAGQTIVVCPGFGPDEPAVRSWFSTLVSRAGAFTRTISAAEHDFAMAFLQTASHQSLLAFADVLSKGPFSPDLLWELRTPLFEMLLALAGRVLQPGQQGTIASIQLSTYGVELAREFADSIGEIGAAAGSGDQDVVESLIARIRDHFTAANVETLERTASLAIASVQATRQTLASAKQSDAVVALRHVDSGRLHAGVVIDVSSTGCTLEDCLVSTDHGVAFLRDGAVDARDRLGLRTRPAPVHLSFANAEILTDSEFEEFLDRSSLTTSDLIAASWPWSWVDSVVLQSIGELRGVVGCAIEREVVWKGRREVLLRVDYRIDRDPADIRAAVLGLADLGSPPGSLSGGLAGGVPAKTTAGACVYYLGPAGTFSEQAARRIAGSTGGPTVPAASFDEAIDGILSVDRSVAVIPLVNSSSGLVERSASALHGQRRRLEVIGVVDVPVGFSLYGTTEGDLRGRRVFSHPQGILQCRRIIEELALEPIEVESTVEGVQRLAADPDGLALAPSGLAPEGVTEIRQGVGDESGAVTRFVVVRRRDAALVAADGPCLWVLERSRLAESLDAALQRGARVELFSGGEHVVVIASPSQLALPIEDALGPTAWEWVRPK